MFKCKIILIVEKNSWKKVLVNEYEENKCETVNF